LAKGQRETALAYFVYLPVYQLAFSGFFCLSGA